MTSKPRCRWIKTTQEKEQVEVQLEDGSVFVLTAIEAKKRYGVSAQEKDSPRS